MIFDAAMSGDEDFINRAKNLRKDYETVSGDQADQAKDRGAFEKVVNSTVEMLPMMGKGAALNMIPGVGQYLSGAMWARQGARGAGQKIPLVLFQLASDKF
jgi:hypothetical protein